MIHLMKGLFNGGLLCFPVSTVQFLFFCFFTVIASFLWCINYQYFVTIIIIFSLALIKLSFSKCKEKITSEQLIVITGCDSGLGYSLALHCRFLGATVLAGVMRENGPGAIQLKENGIIIYTLDLTDPESVKQFGDYARKIICDRNLVLYALINNAGVMIFGEYDWQTEEQIKHQVEVNMFGTMRITKEFMPVVRKDLSRIIMITSHCAYQALPGVSVYSATKTAIRAWATSLRVELKKYGIRVVSFVPGSFTRESNIFARQKEYFDTMEERMSQEDKDFYGDYFIRYVKYLTSMSQEILPRKLENPQIYRKFEGALLDKHPSEMYKCESWRYFFYHTLFKLAPTCLRDQLVEMFVQMPSWNDSRDNSAQK